MHRLLDIEVELTFSQLSPTLALLRHTDVNHGRSETLG